MARLHPDTNTWRPTGAGQYTERAVLEQLRDGLPDGFDVFHSVDWSTVDAGTQHFGEIDVVVVEPQGHLVLLEIKAGSLEENGPPMADGLGPRLAKRYGAHHKDVIAQSNGQLKAMRQRLQNEGFDGFRVAHLIVLPDHTVTIAPLGFPRERIIDSKEVPELCHRILQVINQGQDASANSAVDRSRLLLFLANHFQLCPDPTARIGTLNTAVKRLSDGLATWVPRIHSEEGIFVVEATAGSGKTQLALRLLSESCAKGLRCMYVCYNRPLADRMVQVAPTVAQVINFHELAIEHFRRKHGAVDFAEAGLFERVAREFVDDSLSDAPADDKARPQRAHLDLLVIDEMQDMEPQWVEALASRLKSDGRMYLLGDSQQSVYQRDDFDLSHAVSITCSENFRSPRHIVDVINLLGLSQEKITAHCPEVGEAPQVCAYADSDVGGVRALDLAVAGLLAKGVDPSQIAIVTFAGRNHSKVLERETVGGLAVRKYTGQFDRAGNPIWTEGALLVETLYRFKGQAAPYVILCEVEFETLDEKQRRKLFVGMTRAQLHLVLIMSKAAEMALMECLNAE
jgi:hypothetical protein